MVIVQLSYAVGSAIPFIITLTGDDAQTLDVLGKPSVFRLRLVRSMATGSEATDDMGPRRTDNHFLEHVGQAYFWDSKGAVEVNKRVFQGEMELVKTLKPSFIFPNFAIRVSMFISIGIIVIVDDVYWCCDNESISWNFRLLKQRDLWDLYTKGRILLFYQSR